MLNSPFLEFVQENARPSGNFSVGLPEFHSEIVADIELAARGHESQRIARDHVIDHVIVPLLALANDVRFFYTAYTPDGFGGEGATLPQILTKVGRQLGLVPGIDPIEGFRQFWGGWSKEQPQQNSRGYVLFMIENPAAALSPIFAHCYDPGVVNPSSIKKSMGRTLNALLTEKLQENPAATAIVLGYIGSLSNLTVLPGPDVFDARLNEAICATKTYERYRVDFNYDNQS
ncbi:hypothetical protein SAMN02745857_04268 [Andreprevotia lacus DSM 23236]|jgi:hypothetical protein|uniref:Uncharacterized protein n=1 Tax=Andreprevotia lacus DSM 23236 TaxID=1121001 RepID=A0A1W1Y1C1_9NEIS|nr:hypothetical protein [Andreprevotia lacus]SMC29925.1 hypothetical protein SAMN02745857_04268 [Andreprevotia lacus DSM 23236]